MRKVVIFGATSAIAAATARLWVAQGCDVFLIGRNASRLAALKTDLLVRGAAGQYIDGMQADLNALDSHANLFDCAERTLGGLDTVLIAYGSLPDQQACEQSVGTTLSEIHTNALSAISLLSHAANRFEVKGCGTIAAISSVAGDRGRQSNYVYGAAKGMLTLFMQGLRNRLYRHGVAVVTIKPGFVDTPMTAGFAKSGHLWAQPEAVARGIVKAVDQGRDVAYLPSWWRWIMLIIRHIPERIFKRLSL